MDILSNFTPQPKMEQYFLSNPKKIDMIVKAANIEPDDEVLELGAGIGSITKQLPRSKKITLIELDEYLVNTLKDQFSYCHVLQADAIDMLTSIKFDILLSNLPFYLTDRLLNKLAKRDFKTALLTIHYRQAMQAYSSIFHIQPITTLEGDDFSPKQPFPSRVIKIIRQQH